MFEYNVKKKVGGNILDKIINKLPLELHVPGYQFCGPGTKLEKRLKRGDKGINKLDSACKEHDIAYDKHKSGSERRKADRILGEEAFKRFKSSDSSLGEKAAALAVSGIMKAKSALGCGLDRQQPVGTCSKIEKTARKQKKSVKKESTNGTKASNTKETRDILKKAIDKANKKVYGKLTPKDLSKSAKVALKSASNFLKKQNRSAEFLIKNTPRIIPVPKIGGILPLVPFFAGLSALGSLVGGVSSVTRAAQLAQKAKENLSELTRHNKQMEAIALGKTQNGNGLYLKPYRTGLGLYLKPFSTSDLSQSTINTKN